MVYLLLCSIDWDDHQSQSILHNSTTLDLLILVWDGELLTDNQLYHGHASAAADDDNDDNDDDEFYFSVNLC